MIKLFHWGNGSVRQHQNRARRLLTLLIFLPIGTLVFATMAGGHGPVAFIIAICIVILLVWAILRIAFLIVQKAVHSVFGQSVGDDALGTIIADYFLRHRRRRRRAKRRVGRPVPSRRK